MRDPGGHQRKFRVREFPYTWLGVEDPQGLRDQKIERGSLSIEFRAGEFWLCSSHVNTPIQVGDLRVSSLQIPLGAPLRVGDTELIFEGSGQSLDAVPVSKSSTAWLTQSHSGYRLLDALKKASATKLSIYLEGETGTGKEVLAEQIHSWSTRSGGRFVAINCGALPMGLVESELFGHTKGAFTGAHRERAGAFLQAHGGTLFLDEVADLPLEVQVKLLRFLESGEIRPVGSDRTLYADVRVVCATHKPLSTLVQEGKFRQDLYFRIASVPFVVPSLRSRPADIEFLAQKFAAVHDKRVTEAAVTRLQQHPWPGNVRELRHAIERACGLAGIEAPLLQTHDFEFLDPLTESMPAAREDDLDQDLRISTMERNLLIRALRLENGNRAKAAERLGVARSTLFEMIKRYGLVGPRAKIGSIS